MGSLVRGWPPGRPLCSGYKNLTLRKKADPQSASASESFSGAAVITDEAAPVPAPPPPTAHIEPRSREQNWVHAILGALVLAALWINWLVLGLNDLDHRRHV